MADSEHFLQTADILSPELCICPGIFNSWELLITMDTELDQSLWTISGSNVLKRVSNADAENFVFSSPEQGIREWLLLILCPRTSVMRGQLDVEKSLLLNLILKLDTTVL